MARIRSIHPGFWTDDAFAALSDAATLLYIGLLNEADDHGIFEWKPLSLRMRLRPTKDGGVEALLEELVAHQVLRKYEAEGHQLGAIRNFCKYQRPKFPKFTHTMPEDIRNYVASTQAPPVEKGNGGDVIPRNAEKVPQREMEEGVKEGEFKKERFYRNSEKQKRANGRAGAAYVWIVTDDPRWVLYAADYRSHHRGKAPPTKPGLGGMGWHFAPLAEARP